MHELYKESQQPTDCFMWMTRNGEVELRARGIEDGKACEFFCRNMGGHYSKQHKEFFRFPENKALKGPDVSWVEVKPAPEFNKQCNAYDHTLVGRVLFVSKLEEVVVVHALVEIDGQTNVRHSSLEVAAAFSKRIDEIIGQWQAFLLEEDRPCVWHNKGNDKVVQGMVD